MLGRRPLLAGALTGVLAGVLAGVPRPGRAAKYDDTLEVSWTDRLTGLDPYRSALRANLMLAHEVWDCLLDRDPGTLQLRPLLAASWRAPDPLTLEFTLRGGVWFHDGTPFGAADVVYTVQTVLADKQLAIPGNYAWLAGVEQTGELAVRLRLAYPFAAALDYIAMVLPILPQETHRRLGPEAFALAPVGTGPYRVASIGGPTQRIELARFEAPVATGGTKSPKGVPAIGRVSIAQADNPTAPFNDLVSGRAQWIWQLTPAQFKAVALAPELQALRTESMRVAYLSMDAAGRSGAGNPMTKLLVRQAISLAIDRPALARAAVPEGARVPDAACYPTQFGCNPTYVRQHAPDPDRARVLMQQAGYPFGFRTDLVTYSRPEMTDQIVSDLAAIGILVDVASLPTEAAVARAAAGQAPLFMGSWASSAINDVSAFLPQFFGLGPQDYARVPGLAHLLDDAQVEPDADQRREIYGRALAMIADLALWLPLFIDAATYGVARSLLARPMTDELPRFYKMAWR